MLNTLRNNSIRAAGLKAAVTAILLAGSGGAMAADIHLCATTGSVTLPAVATPVTVWGYALGDATTCPTSVTAPGGPVINVVAGDRVILHNGLTEPTGLLFQGQAMIPDSTGVAPGATNASSPYVFPTTTSPGTYLYQAAPLPNAEHQVAMGLYGALVVRGADVPQRTDAATVTSGSTVVLDAGALATDVGLIVSGTGIPTGATVSSVIAGTSFTMSIAATAGGTAITLSKGSAYGAATTAFDDEAVLVLSEIDTVLNSLANPATFDMRNFAPKYFLINGRHYPNTLPISSAAGHKLLLRYVNAGAKHHSMGTLGLRQNFIAKDGSVLPTAAVSLTAETLAAGQTGDALVSVPGAGSFAVYDASLALHNSSAPGYGGMLTFVNAAAGGAAAAPTTSGVAVTPNPNNGLVGATVNATVSSAASTIIAAEYFIDTTGANGAGTAMTGAFDTSTVAATGAVSPTLLGSLTTGNHTFFVHGQDLTLAWGAFSSSVLNLDRVGPTTSGLTLAPNPSTGLVGVALSATASDVASGASNITAAEYTIDSGSPIVMTLGGTPGPARTLSATIAAGLSPGGHPIMVRSQDAAGNWGANATGTLTIAPPAPVVTSGVVAAKSPNNGTVPLSSSQSVVRVTASMSTTGTTVAAAEVFIDTVGANGTGFPMVPSDGRWNGATEAGYADIPLSTIITLSTGTHTIYVHGKSAAGVWGTTTTGTLLIDKIAPTISSATLSAGTIAFGAASVTLTVTAADTGGAGLAGGQYWIDGSASPPASPSAFAGTSAVINTSALAGGTHTVYVRMKDAATNYSAVSNATLYVVRAVNNTYSVTANISPVQTVNVNTTNGVLTNDQPTGVAGRAASPANPVVTKLSGPATGSMTVTLNATGSFSYTVSTGVTGGAAIQTAKRGTYQITYTETLNTVTGTATATITVN